MARRFSSFANIRSALRIAVCVAAAAGARGHAGSGPAIVGPPFDVLASGFEDASGLAIDTDGSVLVTDRRAGTLTRVTQGDRQILLANLQQPRGVAIAGGSVFVLEAGVRLLRLDSNGLVSVISASLKQAHVIAAGPDDSIWIAARREHGPDDEIVRLESSGEMTRVASGLIGVRAIAADEAGIYVAVQSLAGEGRNRTTVARLPLRADGTLGPVESVLRNAPRHAAGVAIDAAGDLFITASGIQYGYPASGVVLKRRTADDVAIAASGLSHPGAAAFGPARDLFVVERTFPARVLRFRPPPPPLVDEALFTNRTPLQLTGAAQAGSLVQAMVVGDGREVVASGVADSVTGAFALTAPLAENAETRLSVVATGGAGDGLVGLPAMVSVVHDDHLPAIEILEPPDTTHVQTRLVAHARASDEDSGLATLGLMIDEVTESVAAPVSDAGPVSISTVVDVAALSEGDHTLTAAAVDRAGNWRSVSRLIVVDRTPPDTFILTGPPPEAADRSATFTFGGSDQASLDLEFAWRLDAGSWSPFSPAAVVQLMGLAAGAHRFEVVARDRAGNVDATPAAQSFATRQLRVHIVEPLAGAVITTGTAWVRGTVDGGSDVALSVPLPPALQQVVSLDVIPAPHEAGTFAFEIPVVPGMSVITVVAHDAAGAVTTEAVPISVVEPLSASLRLDPFPAAGLAPLTVRFPGSLLPAGTVYSIDLESDGIPDGQGNALPDSAFVYTRPGIHVVTLQATTPTGTMLVAKGLIQVYDRARLEARLGALWGGFKAALREENAAAAASFVHGARRAAWAAYFEGFTPAQFVAADAMFTDLQLLEVAPGRAECEMMRDEDGLLYSFPVSFAIDVDGRWKLWQF